MNKYVFLTGATGLVGRYLMRDLMLRGKKLAVLIRAAKKATVLQRLEVILQKWEQELGVQLPRPVCFEGDVCQENLGLDEESLRWVTDNCDTLIHNAAILTFYGTDREGEPWKTNVGGTQKVLDFCQKTSIDDLHYVSTAYVCGQRDDLVYETELNPHLGFRNDYEESKYLSEKMVREAEFLKQLTVYRPAVIAGDSVTGYTNTYHGLYMYLKMMSVLVWNTEPDENGVRHTPVSLNMTGDEPRNVVPVDWVSEAITQLFCDKSAHGGTYHLSPSKPITPKQIINAGYRYFNSHGVEYAGADPSKQDTISEFGKNVKDSSTIYQPYEVSDPLFDTTELQKQLPELPCPEIDEAMLHRFWKYGEEDRWGKRREEIPEIDVAWQDNLMRIIESQGQSKLGGEELQTVGLNILGSGGGQWTIVLNGSQITKLTRGLPLNRPVLTFESSALAEALNDQQLTNGKLHAFVKDASDGSLKDQAVKIVTNSLFQSELAN